MLWILNLDNCISQYLERKKVMEYKIGLKYQVRISSWC
jgi:hypothetical protein